ncbi:hypothetical protein NL676_034015 [Syzygium grande]|nr:hypothetical protein NL676_034015 [Syzygium grande]
MPLFHQPEPELKSVVCCSSNNGFGIDIFNFVPGRLQCRSVHADCDSTVLRRVHAEDAPKHHVSLKAFGGENPGR